MDFIRQKLIKEFDKISYVDFKRLEEEPIDLEYLKKRKEKTSKQFKFMQIISTISTMILVAGGFYLLGVDSIGSTLAKSILNTIVILIIVITPQLIWNKKYTEAQKNIFIIELLVEIEKNKANQKKS